MIRVAVTVLVADDSVFMRKMVENIIHSNPDFKVIGTARNGGECMAKLISLNPKIIILDIMLPDVSGLDIVYQIMRAKPTPVLLFSSLTETEVKRDARIFDYGIVDFINKPTKEIGMKPEEYLRKVMIPKLAILSKLRISKFQKLINMTNKSFLEEEKEIVSTPIVEKKIVTPKNRFRVFHKVVVIGASTGGPQMIAQLIQSFPRNFPPVLIVQHIPKGFIENFAKRLAQKSRIEVRVATNDETIKPGTVYLAPGGRHMLVKQVGSEVKIQLDDGPYVNFVKPSVDVTLKSAVKVFGNKVVAVILTGMGRDGADGCRDVHKRGGTVLALNEEDSVVYGMNKAVIEGGHAHHIYSLDEMYKGIAAALGIY